MGNQINYYLGYEDFLQIAQTALNCGCVIIKPVSEKLIYGQSLDIITADSHCYYFYLPEAGKLMAQQLPFPSGQRIIRYDAAGNTVIEAGFSNINYEKKNISKNRLFVISGYYNANREFVSRPDCLTKTYNKLVRVVKKIAPYTELTDYRISLNDSDYLQEKEWKHKEYVSPSYLALKVSQNYYLGS